MTGDRRSFPADLRHLSADLASYADSGAPGFAVAALAARAARPAAARPLKRLIYRPGKAPAYKPRSHRLLSKKILPHTCSLC